MAYMHGNEIFMLIIEITMGHFCRVHTSIQEVLARCVDTPDPVKKLLDPVRLEVTRYDGSKANCVAVIDELEDGRFMLVNVFYDQGALGKPKFDLILPDRWACITGST